jgi:hypothetical protein
MGHNCLVCAQQLHKVIRSSESTQKSNKLTYFGIETQRLIIYPLGHQLGVGFFLIFISLIATPNPVSRVLSSIRRYVGE